MSLNYSARSGSYSTGLVRSGDGTPIGYRYSGSGPGIVIVHGAMQAAQHFRTLARLLSDEFTVYVPDRRGRGRSGPHGSDYRMAKECEDLEALLGETGAHYLFGLSSGALISLYAAVALGSIHKVALYEPPVPMVESAPSSDEWLPRFDREIVQGKLAAALATALRGIRVSPFLGSLPRFVSVPLLSLALRRQKVRGDDVSLKELVPTIRFDARLVKDAARTPPDLPRLTSGVLLLGGSGSPEYLKLGLDRLSAALPHARRVEFRGLDHFGPNENGRPEVVAEELRRFFGFLSSGKRDGVSDDKNID